MKHIEWTSALTDDIIDNANVPTGIGGQYRNSVRAWIVGAIERHCPFLPNVAYMPVPRCDSCKHWMPLKEPDHTWSNCELLSTGTVVSTEGDDVIQTREDFGCVRHEARP